MRRTRRFLTQTPLLLSFVLAIVVTPARAPAGDSGPHTIEPSLPLLLDLSVAPGPPDRRGTWRLRAEIRADAAIERMTLSLALPQGVVQAEGDALDRLDTSMRAGERRSYALLLARSGAGSRDIRLLADYRLADGRTIHTMQGATIPDRDAAEPGKRHAGAYEVMGVQVEERPR